MVDQSRNNLQNVGGKDSEACNCEGGCCPPRKKRFFPSLIFFLVLLAAVAVIVVKLTLSVPDSRGEQSQSSYEPPVKISIDSCGSSKCDTAKGSSCCSK